jgi:hypothetical protein
MSGGNVEIINLVPAAELTPDRERWLVEGLVAALPSLKLRELFEQRRDMFTEADLITVAVSRPAQAAVGALSSRWATVRAGGQFLHVTTQFVGEDYRHGMVFRQSWAAHLATLCAGPWGFPTVSVLKTYNPQVFCAMQAFGLIDGVSFYPAIHGTEPDVDLARLARAIARTIARGYPFNATTGVISGVGVPADLYPALPMSNNPDVNRYFAETTRPGDRVLCMLVVPTPQAVSAVMRHFTAQRRSELLNQQGASDGGPTGGSAS